MFIPDEYLPIELLTPAADSGGRTGDYISLKNADGPVYIVVHINQGAANTVQVDPKQVESVAGTPKALSAVCQIWANEALATACAFTKQTAAVNFTTSAATTHKMIIFQVDPGQHMDVAGGYECLTVSTGASSASNITQAILWVRPKYQGATSQDFLVD